jgi:hypothetical protein
MYNKTNVEQVTAIDAESGCGADVMEQSGVGLVLSCISW